MGVLHGIGRRAYRAAGWLTQPLVPEELLATFNPLWSTVAPHARVVAVRRETADTTTLVLRPGRSRVPHVPGQYVGIGIRVDGVWHWRTYSATSRPGDRDVSVTVTAIDGGTLSGRLAHATEVGAVVRLGPPQGEFVLPEPVPEKLLFITAGSGITPVMSMLRELSVTRPSALSGAVHVHCARTPADVVFGAELRDIAARTGMRLLERHTALHGRLTPESLADEVPDWVIRETWACGPAGLLDDLAEHWDHAGDPGSLHVERFVPPAFTDEGTGGRVTFTGSDLTVDVAPGTPLLTAGEDAGALLPSGCRMGICHTCVGKLRSGAVRDLTTGDVHDTAGQAVRTCVSGAAGDAEIEL